MGSKEFSDSLLSALSQTRVPAGNHDFIRRIVHGVRCSGYRAKAETSKPYVIATRRDGGRDLHIFSGYTVGFTSEEEIVRILGAGAPRHTAPSPKGTWWVEHPINSIYSGSERARNRIREAGFCTCGMQLALTGACDYCD